MNHQSSITAASKAELPPTVRGAQPVRREADERANQFAGTQPQALANQTPGPNGGAGLPANASNPSRIVAGSPCPDVPTGEADATNLPKIYGPLTTRSADGAGGPLNAWDSRIAAALRRGEPDQAAALQAARAKFATAFQVLEPVWVPTEAQRRFYGLTAGLRAGRDGLRTMDAR